MKASNLIVATSFLCLLVSFWNRNDLPGNIDYLAELQNEPVQVETTKRPFEVSHEGIDYEVAPEFEYELYGMVVSYRHHDGDSRMHMLSSDHLNMLDLCVIWGDNTKNAHLDKIKFWNGIFTCNVSTRNQAAWDAFDMYQLSNNHLISDNDFIRDQVKDVQIGDQIRVRGYLASYGLENGGRRGTSTTRLDTGDGACETLFVDRFDIVRPATSYWRISMYGSLGFLCLGLFMHFRQPYRPYHDT